MLKFIWNTWKCWWNEADDEIFSTCVCIISLNFENYFLDVLFWVLLQANASIFHFSFQKMQKNKQNKTII